LERVKISLSPSLPHGRVVNEDEVRAQVERVNPILDLLLAPSLTFVPTGAEPRVEGSVTREDRANAQRAAAYSRNDVAVRIPLENV
jgi:hypothetical protein